MPCFCVEQLVIDTVPRLLLKAYRRKFEDFTPLGSPCWKGYREYSKSPVATQHPPHPEDPEDDPEDAPIKEHASERNSTTEKLSLGSQ